MKMFKILRAGVIPLLIATCLVGCGQEHAGSIAQIENMMATAQGEEHSAANTTSTETTQAGLNDEKDELVSAQQVVEKEDAIRHVGNVYYLPRDKFKHVEVDTDAMVYNEYHYIIVNADNGDTNAMPAGKYLILSKDNNLGFLVDPANSSAPSFAIGNGWSLEVEDGVIAVDESKRTCIFTTKDSELDFDSGDEYYALLHLEGAGDSCDKEIEEFNASSEHEAFYDDYYKKLDELVKVSTAQTAYDGSNFGTKCANDYYKYLSPTNEDTFWCKDDEYRITNYYDKDGNNYIWSTYDLGKIKIDLSSVKELIDIKVPTDRNAVAFDINAKFHAEFASEDGNNSLIYYLSRNKSDYDGYLLAFRGLTVSPYSDYQHWDELQRNHLYEDDKVVVFVEYGSKVCVITNLEKKYLNTDGMRMYAEYVTKDSENAIWGYS